MLLQPFVAAAIVGRQWTWFLIPGLLLILTVFLIREPLLVLARQRFVWRVERPETAAAKRTLLWELALMAACAAIVAWRIPIGILAAFGAVAMALTLAAVAMAVKNRQRSVVLQILSSFGLSCSGLLAALLTTGTIPEWAIAVALLHALHSVAGIFVVHARLDKNSRPAMIQQVVNVAAAVVIALQWNALFAIPVALSVAITAYELQRLNKPEPLQKTGLRTLSLSLVHTAAVIAVLFAR